MRILLIDDTRDEGSPEVKRAVHMIARNYWAGIEALTNCGPWDLVLLDHDLHSYDANKKEWTGYNIICDIEYMVQMGEMQLPGRIECVSSNPPGRARIEVVIKKLYGK